MRKSEEKNFGSKIVKLFNKEGKEAHKSKAKV